MPKPKPVASLSGLVDTDMEDDTLNMDAFPTPDSNQENAGSAKKKGRPAKATAKKFAKTKAIGRRASGDSIPPKKAAPKKKAGAKRAPLKEQTNVRHAEDTEEVDEFAGEGNEDMAMDELVQTKQPAKQNAPAKKAGKQSKKKPVEQMNVVEEGSAQQPKAMEKDGEFEYTPTATRQTKRPGRPAAQKPKANMRQKTVEPRQQEKIIPETQVAMEIDQPEAPASDEEDEDAVPQSIFRRTNNAREDTHQRQPTVARIRAGSISDNERGGIDPATRRKLGEMTKKLEKLDTKYRNLREEGIKEANANFEKYKMHSQANAKAANDLIISLKKELATQKALSKDSASLENEIITRDADLARTQALADQLSTSLSEAQNENKALQAKLANSRSASTAVESLGAKTPGSAMRGKTPAQRTIMVGSAEAAYAAQVAQLKEDLYSDLTGLILRGVERKDESDIYDCIQTGRNGTLHFKLAIAKETDGGYENTEFQYTPRLDSNRDRDMIALLPEYLTDEITFSRTNAAMFYGRVVETLTKKRPVEVQE
ncbi:hypothetical protein HO133_010229 [Letharia lupina]|uniref:Monopolin complex subunit Csm1/Pcs1 C-terminal domain-containing protein n=1 Tax=Letharia lupina TaxID=560253 RepID=A0A8H6FEM5_9LECA|nr:uncharacterized protein HO133_010229 [Letharia lupina]KAF6225034.1 hypothetical protein HO133_010229 [Letharia lupina]